jgi:hypothetical protein
MGMSFSCAPFPDAQEMISLFRIAVERGVTFVDRPKQPTVTAPLRRSRALPGTTS